MIAYFALLSFVPLLFLALALLGARGPRRRVELPRHASCKRAFPASSISSIVAAVREIQDNATALGIVGGVALLWSSLSLFSVLESAFNIVYGRPNRSFLRGKALAVAADARARSSRSSSACWSARSASTCSSATRPASPATRSSRTALSVAVSLARGLRLPPLRLLPADERRAHVPRRPAGRDRRHDRARGELPGAAALPPLRTTCPRSQAFGGPALLLVWLYVMANVIVFGAEVNWWLAARRRRG